MVHIDIKPLSINVAFQGRRFKTPEYNQYINDVLYMLPKIPIGLPPYDLYIEFGTSKLNDLDNNLKPFIDCLVKKYGFDDRDIYFLSAKKVIVKKGAEYVKFKIEEANP
jgi:hypothetical protein